MKKMIAVLLALFLPVTGALADVLSDGWKDADNSQIQAAIDELTAELREREEATHGEVAEAISGSGTMITQITVKEAPARITLTCTDKETSTPARISGGSRDIELNPYRSGVAEELISETGTFTAMIETAGDWTLTVEPLATIGAFTAFEGHFSAFTDVFTLDGPTIVTLAVEPANDALGSFIVELWYLSEFGWSYAYDSSLIADLKKDEAYSYDMILKPVDGATVYAFRVYSNYDNLGWTITAK